MTTTRKKATPKGGVKLLESGAMAFDSDSLNKRTLGPALGSAVVGVALGVVTILGIAQFSQADAVPNDNSVKASDAVMGGPEYGSRE